MPRQLTLDVIVGALLAPYPLDEKEREQAKQVLGDALRELQNAAGGAYNHILATESARHEKAAEVLKGLIEVQTP